MSSDRIRDRLIGDLGVLSLVSQVLPLESED